MRPRARLDLAPRIADLASAAIDVSDGLAQDLAHLCQASQVAARLEIGRVPRAPDFEALARELGEDPARLLLGGGEDYELLFTASAAELDFAVQIGSVVAGAPGVTALDADGAPLPAAPGFDHFR